MFFICVCMYWLKSLKSCSSCLYLASVGTSISSFLCFEIGYNSYQSLGWPQTWAVFLPSARVIGTSTNPSLGLVLANVFPSWPLMAVLAVSVGSENCPPKSYVYRCIIASVLSLKFWNREINWCRKKVKQALTVFRSSWYFKGFSLNINILTLCACVCAVVHLNHRTLCRSQFSFSGGLKHWDHATSLGMRPLASETSYLLARSLFLSFSLSSFLPSFPQMCVCSSHACLVPLEAKGSPGDWRSWWLGALVIWKRSQRS